MEREQLNINKNKDKKVVFLVGKCGKCKRSFTAEAVLPTIIIEDEHGYTYRDKATPHLVTLCPFCFSLLNLAKRVETNKEKLN
jgi:hypothetical protein